MSKFAREIFVGCPPARVFALLADVNRLPEFSHMTSEIRNAPSRPLEVGDQFEQAVKMLGVEFDTEWTATEIVADSTIRVEGKSKGNGRASLTETLTSQEQGTLVRFEVDYDPPFGILGEIADKVMFERRNEEDAEQILASLKSLCEAAPPT